MSAFHWRSTRLFGAVVLPIILMGFVWGGQTPRALAASSSTITISTSRTTQSLGAPVTLTATVLDGSAQPISGVAVTFVLVSGPDAGESDGATTDGNGLATSSFTGTHGPGIDMIGSQFVDTGGNLVHSDTVQVLWGTDPSNITLNPSTTTQNLGTSATVTAIAIGPDGNPAANQTVTFTIVNGPDAGSPIAVTTDSNGHGGFKFTNTGTAGTDIVQASFTDSFGVSRISNQVQVVFVGDTTPPSLSLPSPITVDATSPQGAVVTYTVAATDDDGLPPTVTCTSASGSTFAIGTTIVFCSATDAAGNTTAGSFQVVVNDTDLGLTNMPSNITNNATSPQGGVVNYKLPTTVDEDSSAPAVSCTPTSGSTFAIGTTTVTCTATDSDDTNSPVSQSFQVTVNPVLKASGKSVSATEESPFSSTVATGTYSGAGALSASINWGDGSSSPGSVSLNADGSYSVTGSHTYGEEGSFDLTVQVSESGGQSAAATAKAAVVDAPLTITRLVVGTTGKGLAGLAATFTDADPAGTVSDYLATISWGDGATSPGLIAKNPTGAGFVVAGAHQYAKAGTYTVTLTIRDGGGSSVTRSQTLVVS